MQKRHIGELVFDEQDIQKGVREVAAKLNERFAADEVVIISMVPGGMLFTADLVRKLTFDVKMDYVSCPHTPGDRQNSSNIVYHQNVPIKNQHVILVDDAIESGGTMNRVASFISDNFGASSVSIATLFVKPGRVSIPVTQYYGYEMDNDDLLVGYGLPWLDKYRNVPFVSKLIRD